MKKPRLFISHAWTYHQKYDSLITLLENRKYFEFYNHSVPLDRPLEFKTTNELNKKLRNQMQGCQVVLILGGVFASYRKWMKKEIEFAIEMDKPVIGIRPRGQEKLSSFVKTHANEIVNWNTESVIKAIRSYL